MLSSYFKFILLSFYVFSLWNKILKCRDDHVLAAATDSKHAMGLEHVGLVENHAYALLRATFVPYYRSETKRLANFYSNVKGNRLLKIRNPWGNGEWTGKWSDGSSAWTDDLKRELEWSSADDGDTINILNLALLIFTIGTFWMDYDDFLKYFAEVTINYVQSGWHHQSMPGKHFYI